MKILFDPLLVEGTRQRILQLRAESERQWGSMEIAQTLAHCTSGIEMAMGSIQAKPAPSLAVESAGLSSPWFSATINRCVTTRLHRRSLFTADPTKCDFGTERSRLIAAIENFGSQGPTGCCRHAHPFFGPLTPQQWAILMYKHIDHHLRQFGV